MASISTSTRSNMNNQSHITPTYADIHIPITRKTKPLDKVAFLAIFLQSSELYRPLGYFSQLPSSQTINIAFLAFFSFYLLLNYKFLIELSRSKIFIYACILLFGMQFIIMMIQLLGRLISPDRLIYWTAFSFLYFEIFVTSAILWGKFGGNSTIKFFLACIAATWLGFFIQILDYQTIRNVMDFTSNEIAASDTSIRMIGFFQHPNMAALSLVTFFLMLATTKSFHRKNILLKLIISLSVFFGIVMTGSRTSLILYFITLFWYFMTAQKSHNNISLNLRFLKIILLILLIIIIILISYTTLSGITTNSNSTLTTAIERLESLIHIFSGSALKNDESAILRYEVISAYATDIIKNPFLGHGPDFATTRIEQSLYTNVSQNSFIEWSLKFGVFYAIFAAFFLIKMYFYSAAFKKYEFFSSIKCQALVTCFLVAMLSVVDIFWYRSIACALGAAIGLIFYERNAFQYREA